MKAINLFWLLLFAKSKKKSPVTPPPPPPGGGGGGGGEDLVVPICLKNLGDFTIFLFKLENCIIGLFNISSKRF